MSKRLRLSADADMEERCFQNPYPDWDQGAPGPPAGAEAEPGGLLDAEGQVSRFHGAVVA